MIENEFWGKKKKKYVQKESLDKQWRAQQALERSYKTDLIV